MIWLVLALLLFCSGTVSASETALFGLGRRTFHEFTRSGGPLGRRVPLLMQQPRRVLMTVLITNTAVNVAIFAVSFVALRELRSTRPAAAVGGSVATLLAVVIVGEMVPKAVVLANAQRFAPAAGALIAVLQLVLTPLRWILQTFLVDPLVRLIAPSAKPTALTTDDLRLLVEHSAHYGVIDARENEMLQATVALADVRVGEVMTPRVDVQAVGLHQDRKEVLTTLRSSRRRKVPVWGRNLDDILGIVYARDVYLHPRAALTALVKPVHFVPEQINLVQLIRYFRNAKVEFAIVVDEYGGTAGLVSMEDVGEWIVGDLPDPEAVRPTPTTERIDENTYRVSGDLSVRLWADQFAVGEVERHIDTVGGLVLAKLGRLPRVGDTVRVGNLTLKIEAMHQRRIERVLLQRSEEGASIGEGMP